MARRKAVPRTRVRRAPRKSAARRKAGAPRRSARHAPRFAPPSVGRRRKASPARPAGPGYVIAHPYAFPFAHPPPYAVHPTVHHWHALPAPRALPAPARGVSARPAVTRSAEPAGAVARNPRRIVGGRLLASAEVNDDFLAAAQLGLA